MVVLKKKRSQTFTSMIVSDVEEVFQSTWLQPSYGQTLHCKSERKEKMPERVKNAKESDFLLGDFVGLAHFLTAVYLLHSVFGQSKQFLFPSFFSFFFFF
jgi:hypothetical protein